MAPAIGSGDPSNKRLTISQLADNLQLSTATVSLALRGSPVVARKTRERVQKVASELGYIYNRSAASLRTARTNLVGVTVHDILNPYFAEIFLALEKEFDRQHRTMLVSTHHDDIGRQRSFVNALLQQRADGVVICPSVDTTSEEIARIRNSATPVVLICRDVDGAAVPGIRGDDFAGAKAVADHLIALGHKRIAMVGGRRGTSAGRERHGGYLAALQEAGLAPDPALDFPELMTQADGRDIATALLALSPRPTALMCFNDLVALGVMSALRRHGVEPGRDIAISGYDNIDGSDFTLPALTTVDNNPEEIGRRAAQILQAQMAGETVPADNIRVVPHLMRRDSTPDLKS